MKKWIAVVSVLTVLLLAGCHRQEKSAKSNTSTEPSSSVVKKSSGKKASTEESRKSSVSKETSQANTGQANDTTPSASADHQAPAAQTPDNTVNQGAVNNAAESNNGTDSQENPYPYGVASGQVDNTYRFHGMNVPDAVNVNTANGTVTFDSGGTQNVYSASYQEIPTRTIRVFSASDNSVREVQVNTEVVMGNLLEGDPNRNGSLSGNLYAFQNSNGGTSLATPNYAGNVPMDMTDVMIEVLP